MFEMTLSDHVDTRPVSKGGRVRCRRGRDMPRRMGAQSEPGIGETKAGSLDMCWHLELQVRSQRTRDWHHLWLMDGRTSIATHQ